ncbi:MAG TPA: DNA polymerase III subunit delta' [Cyanobacteria bacterium UBA12227]|nr:DNA polymerase III subunit delta' [Cyanobacteria bacterium UBA12227]HAX88303.1 DNA polymerase III subunit delta' [Cyanobacteria bacterium UBA11370]
MLQFFPHPGEVNEPLTDPLINTHQNPFDPIVGQDQAIALLQGAITTNRIAPAYLFAGPVGVGKRLIARCFVSAMLSHRFPTSNSLKEQLQLYNHPDLLWVEPTYLHQGNLITATQANTQKLEFNKPPQIRIEQVREVSQFLSRRPLKAPRSLVVIEQADTLADSAANALLKTLEEPGSGTLIITASSTHSLLPTIVSRCTFIPFRSLERGDTKRVLQQTGNEEILADNTLLELSLGSPGKAIAAFNQLNHIPQDLRRALTELPLTTRKALELAYFIDKTLDTQTQLWLVDYLQQYYWELHHQPSIIQHLENARNYIRERSQSRLVWEVTLVGEECMPL